MNFHFPRRRIPTEPGRDNIVPRIKSTQMLEGLAKMGYSPDQFPLTEHLVADLVISYAFDMPEMFQMVTAPHLERLSIKPEELRAIAIANLKRQLPQIGFTEESPVMRVVTGNSLEACVLLADSWWRDKSISMSGEIVASVPSRDVLLFCSRASAEGVRALREWTVHVHDRESTHALSKCLLVWREGRWIVL